MTSYTILATATSDLAESVTKANRRLSRAGITEQFSYTLGEPYARTDAETGRRYSVIDVDMSAPVISLAGWEFRAALASEGDAIIVRQVPGTDLDGYTITSAQRCDHCGHNRHRTTTYVVRNTETGEYRQVGSSCLEVFLGLKPRGLWAMSALEPMMENYTDISYYGGAELFTVDQVIRLALVLSDNGANYISSDKASWSDRISTGNAVTNIFTHPWGRDAEQDRIARETLDAAREVPAATVAEVLATVQAQENTSSYIHNVQALAGLEFISYKSVKIAASMVTVWARVQRQARERANRPSYVAGHLGEVKQKITVAAEVIGTREIFTDFGTSILVTFRAENGMSAKWFCSNPASAPEEGAKVTVTGTIKKLEEYRGQDQTLLTRCRVVAR